MIMNESSVVRHALIKLLADELLAVLDEDALCVLANLLTEEVVDGSVLVAGGGDAAYCISVAEYDGSRSRYCLAGFFIDLFHTGKYDGRNIVE